MSNSNTNPFRLYGSPTTEVTPTPVDQKADDMPVYASDDVMYEAGFPVPQEDFAQYVVEDESDQVHSRVTMEEDLGPDDPQDLALEDELEDGLNAGDVPTSISPRLLMPPPVSTACAIAALLLLSAIITLAFILTKCAIPCFGLGWVHNIRQVVTEYRGTTDTEGKHSNGA